MFKSQVLKIDREHGKYAYLLYLLYPVLSLFLVFRDYKAPWAKNVVWLFTIFYGFTFYISSDSSSDAVRYKETLLEMGRSDLDINSLFTLFFADTGSYIDIAQPLLTFLVSRFTVDHRFLFAAFGFFYGYLYSRNIWYLINRGGKHVNFLSKALLIFFAFIVGISSMNGIRFWMATHLFFFGMILFVFEHKKKGFWIAASAILVHFSFILPVLVLCGYILMGNRLKLCFGIFIVSFFVSELNLDSVNNVVSYLPIGLQNKSNDYLNEDYIEKVQEVSESKSWFIPLTNKGVSYAIAVLVIFIFVYHPKYLDDPRVFNVFCAGLLFYGIFNILSVLPSFGRFLSLSKMLLISAIYWASVANANWLMRQLLLITLPCFLLFVILQFRIMMEYSSYLLVFSNPILSFFMNPDMGILDVFLK